MGCSSSAEPQAPSSAGAGTGGANAGAAGTASGAGMPTGGGGTGGGAAGSAGAITGGSAGTVNAGAGGALGGSAGATTGGAAGASGAAGAAVALPPGTGGPSVPCTAVFCEDFEGFADGTTPANARWVEAVSTAAGDMVVDSKMPARGKHALHIKYTTSAGEMYHWLRTNEPFPKLAGKHYARVFVYLNNPPPPTEYRHFTMAFVGGTETKTIARVLGAKSPNGGGDYAPMLALVERSREALSSDDGTNETIVQDMKAPIKGNAWECYEWSYDSEANSYSLWRDGVALAGANWDATVKPVPRTFDFAKPTYLWFGFTEYHLQNVAWDVYLDELVLDDERIGCDK